MEEQGTNWFGAIFAFVVLNFLLFGFGKLFAPLIWTSEIDRACQQEGYWYGDSASNQCTSYYIFLR